MKRFSATMLVFLLFIGGFFILNFLIPDKAFSEKENRYLSQRPSLSMETLSSGKYMKDFEDYASDQFPGRDWWTGMKAFTEELCGKEENNGVYLAADDTLIEAYKKPDYQQLDKNIKALNTFTADYDVPVYLMTVPGAVEIWREKLPKGAPNYSQKELLDYLQQNLSGICQVDCLTPLEEHQEEYIFYRTDHHWTTLGAYYGYQSLMDAMGHPAKIFKILETIPGFYGTTQAKAGIPFLPADDILIMTKANENARISILEGTESTDIALYDQGALEKRDKYALFFGGNYSYLSIDTGLADCGRILVIKDSYANCLLPFLMQEFSHIDVLDMRFFKGKLNDYLQENPVDSILFCYSLAGFASDTNLFQINRE